MVSQAKGYFQNTAMNQLEYSLVAAGAIPK